MIELELLHYGYLFVLIGTIIEGNATLLTAAFLAHRGRLNLFWVLVFAAAATLIADQVYYLIARRKGAAWIASRINADSRVGRVTRLTKEYGGFLLVASRFMLGFRMLIPTVCGAVGMAPLRFFVWNLTGALLWTGTFGSLGYFGGHILTALIDDIRNHEGLIATFIAIGILSAVLLRTRGREWRDALIIYSTVGGGG